MKTEEIIEMKEILLVKRDALTKRVNEIKSSKVRDEPLSADTEEQSLELENDEVVDALDVMEQKELNLINGALERIEKGSYGVCTSCGAGIGISRLKAIPFTPLCLECADPVKTIS